MTLLKKHFRIWMLQIVITMLALTHISCSAKTNEIVIPRTIEVTGSAEMSIQPDEIKLEIVIATNSGVDKKKEFLKILANNGVVDKNIAFESANNYNWWWYYSNYYNHSEQKYTITIDSTVNAIQLMTDLKQSWVRRINVTNKTNYKLQEYRKQVKIEAVKAAKEKARYLLEALGENLGKVISLTEINGDVQQIQPYYYWNQSISNTTSNSVMNSNQSNQGVVNGVSMKKLRYEVKIIFSIKENNN